VESRLCRALFDSVLRAILPTHQSVFGCEGEVNKHEAHKQRSLNSQTDLSAMLLSSCVPAVGDWTLTEMMTEFFCLHVVSGRMYPLLKLQLLLSLVSGGDIQTIEAGAADESDTKR
jgi:hypothetical protein